MMEIPSRGMEFVLSYCSAIPLEVVDEELRCVLPDYKCHNTKKLDQQANKCFALSNAATISDSNKEISRSFSLGLAVLLGLVDNKENGYWSGLTIVISFITKRQAAFSVDNDRGQGTAMGSIYGILCCFPFERSYVEFKVLASFAVGCLIFSCFLMHGSVYISAVLGGLLILRRKDYGPPAQFAIASLRKDYGP